MIAGNVMKHLTIVCSNAVLYDTVLQHVTYWNQQDHPHVTLNLNYMTPKEWTEKRNAGMILGTVMLLEDLPWKFRFFSPIREYENLDYGVRIGDTRDFSVVRANPDKLLNSWVYEEFYDYLHAYTRRKPKRVSPLLPLWTIILMIAEIFIWLEYLPLLSVLLSILVALLLLQRKYVKQQQLLYGTILQVRSYLILLPYIPKPADIE